MDSLDRELRLLVETLVACAAAAKRCIATAESCTGGLLAGLITEIPGSSAVFDRGFVTYSNEAKKQCLDVPEELIMEKGAVSAEVAAAMVEGLARVTEANLFCSITGVAGPGGGSEHKPVGTVFIGIGFRENSDAQEKLTWFVYKNHFRGARQEVRRQSLMAALELLSKHVSPVGNA